MTPRSRGVGTLGVAGPLTTSLRGLWVSGLLPPENGGSYQRAATPRTGHLTKGDDSDPGLASRRERGPTATRFQKVLSYQRGCCTKGRGQKKPLREREGTQGPWRRGATCCCRLLRQLLLRYGWTVAHVGPFVIFVSLQVKRTVELTACPVCSEGAR